MKKGMALAIAGLALLVGCDMGNKATNVPLEPKWKGAPYRLALDAPPAKPNPTGVTLPAVKFTANPDALETRAILVVRFDMSQFSKNTDNGPVMNQMVGAPVDIHGADGTLPADYMESVNKDLSRFLGAYCAKGKINLSVALARSSLNSHPTDSELDSKRLSDWTPVEVDFKNPHPKC